MNNKPTVHYTGKAVDLYGKVMLESVIDHPNHLPNHNISPRRPVLTSTVLSDDLITGRIETKNTIYVPVVACCTAARRLP